MTGEPVQEASLSIREAAAQQRQRDILVAARRVFFDSGYLQASLDRMAQEAGATKRSLYDLFGSKKALFSEVIAFSCAQFLEALPRPGDLPEDPGEGLRAVAIRMRTALVAPEKVGFQRLVISEVERHPELGRVLYETANLGARRVIRAYLEACVTRGRLRPHDLDASARLVLDLATSALRLRRLLAIEDTEEDARDLHALDQAIDVIVRDHAPASPEHC